MKLGDSNQVVLSEYQTGLHEAVFGSNSVTIDTYVDQIGREENMEEISKTYSTTNTLPHFFMNH